MLRVLQDLWIEKTLATSSICIDAYFRQLDADEVLGRSDGHVVAILPTALHRRLRFCVSSETSWLWTLFCAARVARDKRGSTEQHHVVAGEVAIAVAHVVRTTLYVTSREMKIGCRFHLACRECQTATRGHHVSRHCTSQFPDNYERSTSYR